VKISKKTERENCLILENLRSSPKVHEGSQQICGNDVMHA